MYHSVILFPIWGNQFGSVEISPVKVAYDENYALYVYNRGVYSHTAIDPYLVPQDKPRWSC